VCLVVNEPGALSGALEFVAGGLEAGECCAVLGYARFNERLTAQLRDLHGVDVRQAMLDSRLAGMSGGESAKALRAGVVHFFASRRPRRGGRLLCCLGFGEEGWPDESDLLQLEVQLSDLSTELGIASLCLYDTRQLTSQLLLEGGFGCHRTVIVRGEAHKNPFFLNPASLQRELVVRKREETRLRAWIM
jgi:hypothetical protein